MIDICKNFWFPNGKKSTSINAFRSETNGLRVETRWKKQSSFLEENSDLTIDQRNGMMKFIGVLMYVYHRSMDQRINLNRKYYVQTETKV